MMLAQTPIIERLRPCGFVTLGGALEWAALSETNPGGRRPAGWVVPRADRAADNRNDHGVDQRVAVEWAVVVVLDAVRTAGVGADEQLLEWLTKVTTAMLGWRHPDASGPTLYAGGGLLGAQRGEIAWELRFRSGYHLRSI